MEKYKVVIIGSGIAGMTAAIYLKRGGINPIIIENNAPGGTLNSIYKVENYPGYLSIAGPDLASNIYEQVNNLGIKILFMNIDNIDLDNKVIDDKIEFDYLIIATGRKNRLLNLENEKEYIGRGIGTCALCDGRFYKDKDVVVVGGGSSALTDALYLSSICKSVNIVLRREYFTGEDYLINKVVNTDNINIFYRANVIKYNIDDNKLESVILDNDKVIRCDGIFLALGGIPNSTLFDVKKDNDYIVVDDKCETSIKDVFAVGDVIKKDYYQLINASSEGMIAASTIIDRQ